MYDRQSIYLSLYMARSFSWLLFMENIFLFYDEAVFPELHWGEYVMNMVHI